MNQTTLPSRHSIRNSCTRGLRPSTLPFAYTEAPHNTESLRVSEEETFDLSLRRAILTVNIW